MFFSVTLAMQPALTREPPLAHVSRPLTRDALRQVSTLPHRKPCGCVLSSFFGRMRSILWSRRTYLSNIYDTIGEGVSASWDNAQITQAVFGDSNEAARFF